jgi:hypothetical protein
VSAGAVLVGDVAGQDGEQAGCDLFIEFSLLYSELGLGSYVWPNGKELGEFVSVAHCLDNGRGEERKDWAHVLNRAQRKSLAR